MDFELTPQNLLVGPQTAPVSDPRTLAHDVNNVVTALNGYVELMRHDCVNPIQVLKHAEAMAECLSRLADVAKNMLSARTLERVQLAKQARCVCRSFSSQAEQRHVDLVTELDERAVVVATIADVDRVITNLLGNALQAVPEGGSVKLTTAIGPQLAIFSIQDNGGGVPPALASQLFEQPFTTKPDGHGIGLTSVRQTVEQLGGKIHVTNSHGHGLSIELLFPLAPPAQASG